MKTCRTCGDEKSIEDFYPRRRVCKVCQYAQRLAQIKADPKKHSQRTREWQKKNPEKTLDIRLRTKYGIGLDEYNAMLAAQGGVCAVCLEVCPKGRLSVDHCHKTGRVRGLLCRACNAAIGLLRDNPEHAARASSYLSQGESGEGFSAA